MENNFINWIETNDGRLFYLTDKEIFSNYGQELLEDNEDLERYEEEFEDNDEEFEDNYVFSHMAIKKYFKNEINNFFIKECQYKNFWELDKLPKEIAEKVKDFDKYWGKTFEKYFKENDLIYIIKYAPEFWKEKACNQLMENSNSLYALCDIIENASEFLKEKAWERILKQKLSYHPYSSVLIDLVEKNISQLWKEKIWEELFNSFNFCYLICDASEFWKEKSWKQLIEKDPCSYILSIIRSSASENWKEKAWEELLKYNHRHIDETLTDVITYMGIPELWKNRAWNKLLEEGGINKDYLLKILKCDFDQWKEKALIQFLKQGPTEYDFRNIFKFVPKLWETFIDKLFLLLNKEN